MLLNMYSLNQHPVEIFAVIVLLVQSLEAMTTTRCQSLQNKLIGITPIIINLALFTFIQQIQNLAQQLNSEKNPDQSKLIDGYTPLINCS